MKVVPNYAAHRQGLSTVGLFPSYDTRSCVKGPLAKKGRLESNYLYTSTELPTSELRRTVTGTIQRTRGQLARHPVFFALSAFGGLLLLLGVIYAVRYFPARAKLDAAIAEARANGEPVWFSDLDPGPDRNPSADAELLLALANELVLWEDGDVLEDKLFDLTYQDGAERPVIFTHAEYERMAEYAAANDRVLEEMAEVARRGDCWFKYDYSTVATWAIVLGHVDALNEIRPAAAVPVLAAFGSDQEGAFVAALDRYFDIAEFLKNDPWLVSYGIRLRWIKLAIELVERRTQQAPLSVEATRILAERLAELEQGIRLTPTMIKNNAAIFTIMPNLDDPKNRDAIAYELTKLESGSGISPSSGSNWFEEVFTATPEQRQVARWNSLWNRPQLLRQLAFALDLRRRECEVIDEPGPASRKQLLSLEAELSQRQEQMPLLLHILPGLSYDRDNAMLVRQRLISARLLLELVAKHAEQPNATHDWKGSIASATASAPPGYFSGNPLQYEIGESTISVFDVNPEDGVQVGEFSLRLFDSDESDVETTQAIETTADRVGAP